MSDKKSRVSVSLEDFLRVTVTQRDEFDSPQTAAAELGYTSIESFKQALTRNRKRYPTIFKTVAKYSTSQGETVATEAEALAILEKLTAASGKGGK